MTVTRRAALVDHRRHGGAAACRDGPPPEPLAARIAVLEHQLASLKQQQRDEADACLLRAIGRAIGEADFTVADLCERATIDADLGEALRAWRPKQLGKLFARVVNRDVQGLCVRRLTLEAAGWVWKVDFHEVLGDRP
jgi:hypothetical protein